MQFKTLLVDAHGDKYYFQLCFIALICISLYSCGFKLRGAYKLPAAMQTTYVDSAQKDSTLSRTLIRRLKASGIIIAESKIENAAILSLASESKSKRIVSVDANGRAREYSLSYGIRFNVISQTGDFEIKDQEVKIERDFVFDTEDVLGNSREESKLYEEMQQDLIRLILLRLQSKA